MNKDDEDSVSRQLCGLTNDDIKARHLRLRGSLDLKYPRREASCHIVCGHNDDSEFGNHRCFLAVGHQRSHEFSSECAVNHEI